MDGQQIMVYSFQGIPDEKARITIPSFIPVRSRHNIVGVIAWRCLEAPQ